MIHVSHAFVNVVGARSHLGEGGGLKTPFLFGPGDDRVESDGGRGRDPLFTRAFREILKSSGVETVKLPARSPNLNAYAERFVRSIKSECLAQIIPLGERHLRHAVKEYAVHYHAERNHQGLDNRRIEEPPSVVDMNSAVVRQERLGGVLNYYDRRAA